MTINLYGIKNCDTVKKARTWLDQNEIHYHFHDFRVDGLDITAVKRWEKSVGKDALINKRSTTWKQLNSEQQALFTSETLSENAIALILENPTLIKRPVLEAEKTISVGFKADTYHDILT
ncbi:Regulatory protein Spx [Thalassocella blandensis]|nr:Regulatory protein Spx [Thalassocella blandensis]